MCWRLDADESDNIFDGWFIQFGQRQRLHRRVTEPNKLDECSLTLHHLSEDCFVDSLRDDNDDGGSGGGSGGNNGVRNANESEGGGEFELDELELNEVDDELFGEFDDESIAANECGWIGGAGGGGGGGAASEERNSTVFRENLACNNCIAFCRIIASVCKRSNGNHADGDDDGIGDGGCFSIFVVEVERGFNGIGRAIVGCDIVLCVRSF